MIKELECLRCKHKWIRRGEVNPKTCPKCKSPYWQKPLTDYWKYIRENGIMKRNNK